MPKQKPEKVRQSVDEIATPDKAVEPAPTVRDDMPGDFMAFVRKALNAVNAKLDNIVSLSVSASYCIPQCVRLIAGVCTHYVVYNISKKD